MQIIQRELGPVQANCYVLIEDHHALIIDPGDHFGDLDSILQETNSVLEAIVLTHAHFDHIAGVDEILEKHKIPLYLNPFEFDFLSDPNLNASQNFFRYTICNAKPIALKEGLNQIGHFNVEALFCPGHSIGSTVLIINNKMFSGDVLFQGSIGRVDLNTGSEYAMRKSLNKLKKIKTNMDIYPGHGPKTTLDFEKKYNPYLQFDQFF